MKRAVLALLSLALPILVWAQPGGGGPRFPGGLGQWWENPVANGLNLAEAQNKQIRSIVDIQLGRLRQRLAERDITLRLDDDARGRPGSRGDRPGAAGRGRDGP